MTIKGVTMQPGPARRGRYAVLFLLLPLGAAACGGDSDENLFPEEDVPPPIAQRPLGADADTTASADAPVAGDA
ncbi:MAG: hypothetical protein ACRELV_03455, partial [Longimicrobiales bacterium]